MSRASAKAAKSALIVSILLLASKVLGFFREMLIAAKFGSGMETDTFFVALTVTGLLSTMLRNAISTPFVPILVTIEENEGKDSKIRHTCNIINIFIVLVSVLIAIAFIVTPQFVRLAASAFVGEQFDLAVRMIRIGLPMILFSGVIGLLTGYLHSEQRYFSSAAISIPLNIVYIVFLLVFSTIFGIVGLMVAAVLGTAAQILIQIPEAKLAGFRYSPIFDLHDVYIKRVFRLSIPVLISVAISDLNVVVDRSFASGLVSGSVSALHYGDKLIALVESVFIMAITTVIFPVLAKEVTRGNMNKMRKVMSSGINMILLITIPATVGMVILSQPIVEVAFERGEFTAVDTQMTKRALVFYSLGLVASSLQLLIMRVYYSLYDTITPMVIAASSLILNFGLNLVLIYYMDHAGLALATSIANTLATLILFCRLRKRIGSLGTIGYIRIGIKAGIASAIMGVVARFSYNCLYSFLGVSKFYNLISLLVAAVFGALVYLVLCYILKIDQVRDFVNGIKHSLKRPS